MTCSGRGRVGGAGGCPTVGAGIVSAAGVQIAWIADSAPDDHFTASPHCRVKVSGSRARWWCWWLSNYRCWDCICRRCSNRCRRHIRPRRSFRCRSRLPCDCLGQLGALVVLVAVQLSVLGLYLPPVFKSRAVTSAPDDHFTASPYCRVTVSGIGRVGGAGGCPTVGAGIISSAGVQKVPLPSHSAPDDHFAAGPHCRVNARAAGALVVLVAVQVSSVHPPDGPYRIGGRGVHLNRLAIESIAATFVGTCVFARSFRVTNCS